MKIIGCGNADRGDDQAGILAAERLRDLVSNRNSLRRCPGLLDRWAATDDVILLDAVVTGAPVGTMTFGIHARRPGLPAIAGVSAVSSHGFDIAKAIELARGFGKAPGPASHFWNRRAHFDRGAKISPEVERAVDRVIQKIVEEKTRETTASP